MNQSLPQTTNTTSAEVFEAMFSTAQACKILKLSRPTLIKLVNRGAVPAVRIGRSWKFKPSALRKIVDGHDGEIPEE